MIRVYGDFNSGNCLKVKWALEWLQAPYEWVPIDILKGESRTAEFLAMNSAGQVPVIRFDDNTVLAQSNAILLYLLSGTDLVPEEGFAHARMLEWMFWEQYSHEPVVAVRRFQKFYLNRSDDEIDPALLVKGNAALERMNKVLASSDFLAGTRPSAADLCLLPYTRSAPQGGFDLRSFPHLTAWIDRALDAFRIKLI